MHSLFLFPTYSSHLYTNLKIVFEPFFFFHPSWLLYTVQLCTRSSFTYCTVLLQNTVRTCVYVTWNMSTNKLIITYFLSNFCPHFLFLFCLVTAMYVSLLTTERDILLCSFLKLDFLCKTTALSIQQCIEGHEIQYTFKNIWK